MKIALVHDWFIVPGGAEKVTCQILDLLKDFEVDVYCLADFLDAEDREKYLFGKKTHTSYIQHLPKAKKNYRYYLPLFPHAIRRFDFKAYDLVISSSHSVAKGINAGITLHISYCHTPMRYVWDMKDQYLIQHKLDKGLKKGFTGLFFKLLRNWDLKTADEASYYVANSEYIRKRIKKNYLREATVIYPPVDTAFYTLHTEKENFYVTGSRMVPYKRTELIVEAFSQMPSHKLVVIGDGPEFKKIKALAAPNVEIIRYDTPEVLRYYLQRAKAFVFASLEDFGITPVEAQSCGTPVIAFGKGGATETVIEGETGLFFHDQSVKSIVDAVYKFENRKFGFSAEACRENALRFDKERFSMEFYDFLYQKFFKYCYDLQTMPKTGP